MGERPQGRSAPEVPPTFRKAALRAATTLQRWKKRGRTAVRPYISPDLEFNRSGWDGG